MSRLGAAATATKIAAARAAVERYAADRYAMCCDAFVTWDPKDGTKKTEKPWLRNEYHREIFNAIVGNEYAEVDVKKSKQTYASWLLGPGVVLSGMLTQPGFRAYVQSRKQEVAQDIVDRAEYCLTHLAGPLKGVLRPEDWSYANGVLKIHSFLGREMRSDFTALADGSEQWRYLAASYGLIDEAAFNREFIQSYAAALSACEGGGCLVVNSTPNVNSGYNLHIASGLKLAQAEAGQEAA